MLGKYIKPKSLTWWSGVVPLVAGLVVASEPLHGLSGLVATINAVTGDIPAAGMITYGLTAIGVRGAVR